MIKKKKRIIAKYAEGDPGFFEKVGNSLKNFGLGVADKFKGVNTGDVMGAAAGASLGIANSMGIEQSKAGQVISGIGSVVSMIPGWGLIAGPAIQMLGNFTGGGGSVDENTGEVQKSSGLTRLFGWGRSDASLFRKSNRIKNTKVAKAQTENILAEYYNNPNVEVQPNVLAAEGGIMNDYVMAAVSPGELEIDPVTLQYIEYPGDKGKPNSKDNIKKPIKEGKMIASNAAHMKMDNDKTPADNAKMILDSKMPEEMKRKMIKKLFNWQEANKTKPQQYAMYSNGEDNVTKTRIGNVDEYGNVVTYDGTYVPTTQTTVVKPVSVPNKTTSEKEMYITTRKPAERPFAGAKYVAMTDDRAKRYSDPEFVKHLNSYLGFKENVDLAYEQLKDLPQVKSAMRMYNNDKQKALQHLTSDGKYGNVMHYFYNNYINKRNLPAIDFEPYPLNYAKIENGPIKIPRLKLTPPAGDKDGSVNKTNLGDLAYKAASILTPLLDHAEPEAVNYDTRRLFEMPTYVDVSKQLREIDDSYAMARYNLANISTNTGAGMAYGLLAAANRAKQMSDVYNWQTNAQNQLIGQNVDAYNKWSADYANTMNNVYDKAAANRAAAKNINRQNRATALKNWGQILKDDKQFNMDAMKLQMAKPMLGYGYKDYNQFLKWMEESGYGEQVR